jgi:hypothetical protein
LAGRSYDRRAWSGKGWPQFKFGGLTAPLLSVGAAFVLTISCPSFMMQSPTDQRSPLRQGGLVAARERTMLFFGGASAYGLARDDPWLRQIWPTLSHQHTDGAASGSAAGEGAAHNSQPCQAVASFQARCLPRGDNDERNRAGTSYDDVTDCHNAIVRILPNGAGFLTSLPHLGERGARLWRLGSC